MSSDDSVSPPKRKYKQWKVDKNIAIPLRTIQRLRNESTSSDENIDFNNSSPTVRKNTDNDHMINPKTDSSDDDSSDIDSEMTSSIHESSLSDCIDMESDNDEMDIGSIREQKSVNDNDFDVQTKSVFRDLLYENSSTTVDKSVVRLLEVYVQNRWTKRSLQDTLTLLQELLPEDNTMPETVHKLFKYFQSLALPCTIIKHFYCRKCLRYIVSAPNVDNCFSCKADKEYISNFFEIDIRESIKYMFEHCDLAEKLKQRSSFHDENVIVDITDGSEYIRVNSRTNRGEFDLTLILNTDGLALVKSAKSHCWPLMFMIAELPEHLRESFLIVIGIWYDAECKPAMNTFLKPFYVKFKRCFDEGIQWTHPKTNIEMTTKLVVPLIVADAPARADIQTLSKFNGLNGCNTCEIDMIQSKAISGKRRQRIYPFPKDNIQLRNSSRMIQQASELQQKNDEKITNIKGVKGKSIVSKFPLLDLGTCVFPEYMHCALLGIGKQFLNLWINKKGIWNLKSHLKSIDNFILKIRPPHFFGRMPRNLSLFKYYKASEFYNFILFYSLPTLVKYLPDKYLQHWMLFVRGLFTLLKSRITEDDLQETDILLRRFVKDTESLYGDREMTYNLHQMVHLTLVVKRWGPLWATSAFPFENFNGILAHLVHGTKNLGQEMANNLQITQGFQILRNEAHGCDRTPNHGRTKLIGACITDFKLNSFENELLSFYKLSSNDVGIYYRASIDNQMYTSQKYKQTKSNSYTVQIYQNDGAVVHGFIQFFCYINDQLHIVLKSFTIQHDAMFVQLRTQTAVDHILPIKMGSHVLKLINIDDIKSMFHTIQVDNYICKRPNLFKKNM